MSEARQTTQYARLESTVLNYQGTIIFVEAKLLNFQWHAYNTHWGYVECIIYCGTYI